MVFIADDLGAWLVALVADAARTRLTTWVLGSDQERALRQAANAAVKQYPESVIRQQSGESLELRLVARQGRSRRHERQSTQTTCLHDEPSGAVTGTQPNVIGTVFPGVLRQAGQPPRWVWPCWSTH